MQAHELRIMPKAELKSLLASVVIIKNKYPEPATILPWPFCPTCGCRKIKWTGNLVAYPARWDRGYCFRCDAFVAESDNGPYIHRLECPEEGWE